MSRSRIGLLTIFPEAEYQQRVLPGIFSQAEKYGYDVVVISPLVQISNYNKLYVHGEFNIFKLINFSLFDGFIITPLPMTEERNMLLVEELQKLFEEKCKKPVVSIDMEFGNYPVVYTDDEKAFYNITEHLITKHNCKNFSILGGNDVFVPENTRLKGTERALEKYHLVLNKEQIYEGDFWYSSGESLADRYISGELDLPDAVICHSDHMAIGLTNRLIDNGIKIPQDVIITGYEAVQEASLNNPPITSYIPDQGFTGKRAVNALHLLINPKAELKPCEENISENFCIGSTCGCSEDLFYTRERIKKNQINLQLEYSNNSEDKPVSMGTLLESYMVERLAESNSPADTLGKIYETKYLIKPYEHFYICLNEKWQDATADKSFGYPDRIQIVLKADKNPEIHGVKNHVFVGRGKEKFFEKSIMLPALYEDYDEPQVFYFVPVHFGARSLGYAVLQNNLSSPDLIGSVFRNYMRNVNNALEMSRAKYQIAYISEHDTMTGLYNRRGMERMLLEMEAKAADDAVWSVIVIDMDGLKLLNDTHGHAEGDNGIIALSDAASSITDENEICVRGGGDEFFVIGLGNYTEDSLREKLDRFSYYMETKNEILSIPVSASIGYAVGKKEDVASYLEVFNKADENMYADKRKKKNSSK